MQRKEGALGIHVGKNALRNMIAPWRSTRDETLVRERRQSQALRQSTLRSTLSTLQFWPRDLNFWALK